MSHDRFHDFERTVQLNYLGTIKLTMGLLPHMRERGFGHIVNVSSIGVQTSPPRFSAYVASKAALDQLTNILGAEETISTYAFDPGDMRTELHQRAFPGEDISDRPEPLVVVPNLLQIIDERPPSGRYRA